MPTAMRNGLLIIVLLLTAAVLRAQDFSNKGKDFWIGYGNHVRMFTPVTPNEPAEQMQLYITSDITTTGLVEIPGIAFSQSFSISANQISTVNIPRSAGLFNEGLSN